MSNKNYYELLNTFEGLQKQMTELRAIEQESSSNFIAAILKELKEAYITIDTLVACAKEKELKGSAVAKLLQ